MYKNNFLFNFAVSYLGGGFKRLYAYAEWFNQRGGAYFIVHPACQSMVSQFPNNRFFIVKQSSFERLIRDCHYLSYIHEEIGIPDFYFSFGIPIYTKIGQINWFHLSNILMLHTHNIPLSTQHRLKHIYWGRRIKKNYIHADIISAESHYALGLINDRHCHKGFLSMLGNDDEQSYMQSSPINKNNTAVVIGTIHYKTLEDSYRVFQMLKNTNHHLKLIIIGPKKYVSNALLKKEDVVITDYLQRENVLRYLKESKYYISTTCIEGSYNAAAEGVFFADESYISDIAPHRELLAGLPFDRIPFPDMGRSLLHVKKNNLTMATLQTWDKVIRGMLNHASLNTRI